MPSFRHWLRAAIRLRNALELHEANQKPQRPISWNRFKTLYSGLQGNRQSIDHAQEKGWDGALSIRKRVQKGFNADLNKWADELLISLQITCSVLPPLSDLLADFRQIEEEFEECTLDFREKVLSIKIGFIVLEGINLGPFRVRFFWDRIAKFNGVECFDVIALEPNTAYPDESGFIRVERIQF